MKRFLVFLTVSAVISSAVMVFQATALASPLQGKPTTLEKQELPVIRQAIEQKGGQWIAGETSVSRLSPQERQALCRTLPEPGVGSGAGGGGGSGGEGEGGEGGVGAGLPTAFDWRDYEGENWMTSVKDQGGCGSCWAFGSLAAMEAGIRIEADEPDLNVDLSEQFLVSCSDGSCSGWYISSTLNYLENTGTVDEACFPYQASNGSCSSRCSDWQSKITKIQDWGWVGGYWGPISVDTIKQALYEKGPLPTYMVVYTDFFYYNGDVYEYTWGAVEGGHLVTIVGWNDSGGYWICKNSWDTNWGEGGYFKIRMGVNEVSIEEGTTWLNPGPFAEPPPPPPTQLEDDRIGFFRPSNSRWYLDYNGNGVFDWGTDLFLGPFGTQVGDKPIAGD